MDYIKAHINDYPRKEVAKTAGVTAHTLYRYITILGGTKLDNKLNKETIRKISDMYKTMTAREISELLDIPISTILRQVSKFGLEHDEETKIGFAKSETSLYGTIGIKKNMLVKAESCICNIKWMNLECCRVSLKKRG